MARSEWIERIFDADAAQNGGVVRRKIHSVEYYGGGVDNLLEAVERRGFHLIQIGDQFVILCNPGDMKVLR